MLDSIITNFPSSKITEMINDQIKTMASWSIESHQIDGEPVGGLYSYTMPEYSLSFVELYEEEINEANKRIKRILGKNVVESIEILEESIETVEEVYEDYNTEDVDWDY